MVLVDQPTFQATTRYPGRRRGVRSLAILVPRRQSGAPGPSAHRAFSQPALSFGERRGAPGPAASPTRPGIDTSA